MKVIVINDVHKYSPIELNVNLDEAGENVFLIGDNVDLVNCKKSDVDAALQDLELLHNWHRENILIGNHEAQGREGRKSIIKTYGEIRVIFSHGDIEAWGFAKAMEFRSKPHGASWFKRNLVVPAIDLFRHGKKPSKTHIINAVRLAKSTACSVYISGHSHPAETFDQVIDGVRVVILKRGRNEIIV